MQFFKLYKPLLIIVGISICVSCTQVPKYEIWKPWTRSMNSQEKIITGKTIQLEVIGETKPLLGEEDILKHEMKSILENLLKRRGFSISTQDTDYKLNFSYSSKHETKSYSSSTMLSKNLSAFSYGTLSGTGYSSGLGVSIATAVSKAIRQSIVFSKQTNIDIDNYVHTISIDIYDMNNKVIWVGDSKWNSKTVDIRTDILSAIQILLSDLPFNATIFPKVKEIKEGYALNYYSIHCWNKWFACPALPFRIYFDDLTLREKLPSSLYNEMALAAFLDLIQTAEYALPVGIKKAKSPLNRDLWKKVMLGGEYYMSL